MKHYLRRGLLMSLAAGLCGVATADFTAYNDLACNTAAIENLPAHVTGYQSLGFGWDESGELVDFTTGAATGVSVAVADSGNVILSTGGGDAAAGTDAANYFTGKLNFSHSPQNDTNEMWTHTVTFSGLKAGMQYEFVTYMNRGYAGMVPGGSHGPRWAKVKIEGADALINDMVDGDDLVVDSDGQVRVNAGYNTTGTVVKWSGITADDGTFSVTASSVGDDTFIRDGVISDDADAYGMFGFMLKETAIPEPTSLALLGLGGLALLRRKY
ncbi:PEP-CTERM sorting domain-containing protein [Planctomycetota bacterium]|nr:PEP-CTERM sorting domain-containing protein [Planctomycetota bacterium]